MPDADLERLLGLAAGLRFTEAGRRDYAILLVLARLGLRRCEVAGLRLDDIDWRCGEVTVIGKGDRVESLPLPVEPGEAIVAWLADGRPECDTRSSFTTLRPPGQPLSAGAVGHVVGSACQRAGLARIAAHQLRHTLATA
ncbi:MAG: tyrosine-type recombinase/integrase, partial [Candidatus Phosphoribacter sp.]